MNKNNPKPENGKNHNIILTVVTLLILIACALFTLSVYKHNNVKAVSGMDSVTSVNTPAPENTNQQPDDRAQTLIPLVLILAPLVLVPELQMKKTRKIMELKI